jgi:hypothetical protein
LADFDPMHYKNERAKIKVKPELEEKVMNKIKNHLEEKLE